MNPTLALSLWLIVSLIAGLAGSIAVQAGALDRSSWGGVAGEVGLFLYNIGLPFAALITGALSLDLLGLGTDWFDTGHVGGFDPNDWLRGAGAAVSASAFVLAVLWLTRRSAPGQALERTPAHITLRDAIYEQVHWAFYRSPFVLLFGDVYWGVVAGFALIVVERWARRRVARQQATSSAAELVWLCCLLTSSVLYLATRNLWLMIAADIAIRLMATRALNHGLHRVH